MPLVLVLLSILGWETQKNVNVRAVALAPVWVLCRPGSQGLTDRAPSPALLASPTAPPKPAAMGKEQTVGNNAAFLPYRAEPCCSGVHQKITCFPKGGKLNAAGSYAVCSGIWCPLQHPHCILPHI